MSSGTELAALVNTTTKMKILKILNVRSIYRCSFTFEHEDSNWSRHGLTLWLEGGGRVGREEWVSA